MWLQTVFSEMRSLLSVSSSQPPHLPSLCHIVYPSKEWHLSKHTSKQKIWSLDSGLALESNKWSSKTETLGAKGASIAFWTCRLQNFSVRISASSKWIEASWQWWDWAVKEGKGGNLYWVPVCASHVILTTATMPAAVLQMTIEAHSWWVPRAGFKGLSGVKSPWAVYWPHCFPVIECSYNLGALSSKENPKGQRCHPCPPRT